jgi:hypothetical protein
MGIRGEVVGLYEAHVLEFVSCAEFRALESGEATTRDYDCFIASVVRTHLKSPQLVAFLLAVAPPNAVDNLCHNLLEELGVEEESGVAHPSLLEVLARSAGLGEKLGEIHTLAAGDIKKIVTDPLLYGTLRDVGLSAMCEVTAFEFMLSRVAGRIARALSQHRALGAESLKWFTHHSEVDIRHAEQGLDDLEEYVRWYDFDEADALAIVKMTLRQNVFIKRYFGELVLARAGSLI